MTTSSVVLDFYQLREQPFGVTPDPRYLYFSPMHREALASLVYGIETGRGFLSLVAEPGMGKTTLLFQLLQRWRSHFHSAFLFQTQCDPREFIRYLLDDLGLKSEGNDVVRMHSELNEFLFRESLAGRQVVVFIDEAQNLSDTVLETVRLLSDFEAADKKLLQIILAGQPELAKRLSHPRLAQLHQRIAVQTQLGALPAAEVVHYINHRLRVAGYQNNIGLFTPGALELITERSRGVPRLINNLCFNALSLGCTLRRGQITSEVIREAAADLSLEPPAATRPIARQETAPRVGPSFRPSSQSFCAWARDNLLGQRRVETSVLSLLCVSLMIYFGVRSEAWTSRPSAAINHEMRTASATLGSESLLVPPAADPSGDSPSRELSETSAPKNWLSSFTYVVKPKDTLRDLCVSTLGRYNKHVLSEIQQLNPDLTNPDHLEVGREIRLPTKTHE